MQTAGPALERKGDIAAFLTALEPRSVFFVDEIHRLARTLEETFYPAMEDHRLPITVGQGAGARVVTLELPPVHARRRHHPHRPADHAAARPLRHPGAPGALRAWPSSRSSCAARPASSRSSSRTTARCAIAARSRGTPRVANRLLKRVRDFAEVRMEGVVTRTRPRARRWRCSRSTSAGWTAWTARSCSAICAKFAGGPVGLSTLAVAVGEEQDTIEDVYEPYLLKEGLIKRTPRGRAATPAAYRPSRAAGAGARAGHRCSERSRAQPPAQRR